jgi:hypothetical protein
MIWKIIRLILEMKKQGFFDSNGEEELPDKEEEAIKDLEVPEEDVLVHLNVVRMKQAHNSVKFIDVKIKQEVFHCKTEKLDELKNSSRTEYKF